MRYTVVDRATGAQFIQQVFDTEEEAQARLETVKAKFGDRYSLAVASSDSNGDESNSETSKTQPLPAPPSRPKPSTRR